MVEYEFCSFFGLNDMRVAVNRRYEIRFLLILAILGFLLPVPPHQHADAQNDGGPHHSTGVSQHHHVAGGQGTEKTNAAHHHPTSPDQQVSMHAPSISATGSTAITLTENPELLLTTPVLLPGSQSPVPDACSGASQADHPHRSPQQSSPEILLLTRTFLL